MSVNPQQKLAFTVVAEQHQKAQNPCHRSATEQKLVFDVPDVCCTTFDFSSLGLVL